MLNQQTIDFDLISTDYKRRHKKVSKKIIICAGTGCIASGALEVHSALISQAAQKGLDIEIDLKQEKEGDHLLVSKSGCQGFCQMGPLVTIEPDNILYVRCKPDDAKDIIEQTILGGIKIERLLYTEPKSGQSFKSSLDIPFYRRQHRYVLGQCGIIDPEDIEEYISSGGYKSAKKVFCGMSAEQVCKEILESGLRGRGGGGFTTGKKWQFALVEKNTKKYVICNGDEGDPGAFMDRSLMEGNPHRVLEGVIIAARAIGADEAYIYVRAEYPLAVERIRKAVRDATDYRILGDNVFNSGKSIKIEVMEGAGAFVCGEETALIASIEGNRGMPNPKPPFPAQCGLWGKPTVINNVETLAAVPLIIRDGASVFKKMGTENSPGTKTFALTGHVVNTGLIEVPFGATLREIIFEIGGGVTDNFGNLWNDGFKAVQIGGPSGGCLIEEHLDIPIDFDSVKSVGAMVGSGGLVVMNKDTCMIQVAQFFMQFTQNESCGKCVPCREGTKQMLNMLNDITQGNATLETLELLEELAKAVAKGSLCGLGKTAPNPVLSTLRYFRQEYMTHTVQKRCPAGKCKALAVPEILQDKCVGCGLCAKKCPVNAIDGQKKQPHKIDINKCVKCGLCAQVCKFNAVAGV